MKNTKIGRPTTDPRPYKVTARINERSKAGLDRFCSEENVKNISTAIQELTLPLLRYEHCPSEYLDQLEHVLSLIKAKGEIDPKNYIENKENLALLKEALKPVWEVREKVLSFPPISNIDTIEAGTETKRVFFDIRSEKLINATLKLQMELLDNICGSKI